jgi:hypothetical protein
MKKIYFFITIAIILFVFNLTKIDFDNLFGEDSKIGLIGALGLCMYYFIIDYSLCIEKNK